MFTHDHLSYTNKQKLSYTKVIPIKDYESKWEMSGNILVKKKQVLSHSLESKQKIQRVSYFTVTAK